MLLTDLKVRTAKAQNKAYTLSDSGGLFLLVTPQGSKYWRFKIQAFLAFLFPEKSIFLDEIHLQKNF